MSVHYSASIPVPLAELSAATHGEVSAAPYPYTEYGGTMMLIKHGKDEFEVNHDGGILVGLILRGEDIDSLKATLAKYFDGDEQFWLEEDDEDGDNDW